MSRSLYEHFQMPGNEYRGKPFWSWNGELDREELLRQIESFESMGFGGFFMHSRTGLITEYLGNEWFALTRACAEDAEKRGMEAWLYDEDRWPSGTAGGLVTREPKYRSKFIKMHILEPVDFEWSDRWLAVFTCRLEGTAYEECHRLPAEQLPDQGDGRVVLAFDIVEMEASSFYNGYTYLDTMNPDATNAFINATHDNYKANTGDLFGRAIKGIFTDEPHRGPLMTLFGMTNTPGEHHLPWTYELFDRFRSAYGYDLPDKLPEVFLLPGGQKVSQVKWHVVDMLQQMFLDGYAKPLDSWCRNNGLILTGHVIHEDSLSAQTAMIGSVMRYYEHMEYPGVDLLGERNHCYWVVKQLSSVARQIGRKWLLSELYGCTGWQMSLEAHKAVGNWQTLLGINVRCPHLSWYTMEGEAKRDYPASISFQSAWWQDYAAVETYFARLGSVMSAGDAVCDVLVVHPVESLWCQVYAGWAEWLDAKSLEIQKLEEQFTDVFHWLSGAQIDFDYGDEEMLSRLAAIETGEEGVPLLRVGQAMYRTAVVAGMTTIRSSTLRLLEQFGQAGGRIVYVGDAPAYVDGLPSEACRAAATQSVNAPFEREPLIVAVSSGLSFQTKVVDSTTGSLIPDIFAQIRSDGETDYVVLLNVNRERSYENVDVFLSKLAYAEEWNCATGARHFLPDAVADEETQGIHIRTSFFPASERVFVLSKQRDLDTPVLPRYEVRQRIEMDGPFPYTLDEPNVCLLDRASYSVADGVWSDEMEILQLDREVRRRLGYPFRSGQMIQPWYAHKYLKETTGSTTKLLLKYTFHIREFPENKLFLVVERPDVGKLAVNGRSLAASPVREWWIDNSLIKIPIDASWLRIGENQVEWEVDFHRGVNIEAIYLIGSIGVEVSGTRRTVGPLPPMLEVGDLAEQGLPFYGGTVSYELPWDQFGSQVMAAVKGTELHPDNLSVALDIPGYEGACLRVGSSVAPTRVIPWRPNIVCVDPEIKEQAPIRLDVVLTRRNTFGPHHMVPPTRYWYGPECWITEGDEFTDDYMLVPAGLMKKPRLIIQSIHGGENP